MRIIQSVLGTVGLLVVVGACSSDPENEQTCGSPGTRCADPSTIPNEDAPMGEDGSVVDGSMDASTGEAAVVPGGRFTTLPPGSTLPSDTDCALRVRKSTELRADNVGPNAVRGTSPHAKIPRVTGDFVGTTDEILQWAACKWGIDEDLVRAQAAKESYWHQSAKGDLNGDQNACYPSLRTSNGAQCPESVGILQVRYLYHTDAFKDGNALLSTAYNADYTYAVWRSCFEGKETWLNQAEKVGTYAAGDALGCLGVWFSGRWRVPAAETYIQAVLDYQTQKIWTTQNFTNG